MVLSEIDKSINYKEIKALNDDDIDYETNVYSGQLFEKYVEFALGKPKYFYIEKNIIFFYIYLVHNATFLNIGVFEILSSDYPNMIDDDGNILVNKLNKSLIFEFAENYITKKYNITNQSNLAKEDEDKGDKIIGDDKEAAEIIDKKPKVSDEQIDKLKVTASLEKEVKLKEETKENDEEERRIFVSNKTNYWLEEFFKNNNYSIKDNEAGGDCLFASIRDGLEGINQDLYKDLSVKSMREKLALEINKDIFDNYKEQYEMFYDQYNSSQAELKQYAKRHKEIKELLKTVKSKDEQIKLVNESKALTTNFNDEKTNNQLIRSMYEEYKYMKNIKTVEEFKDYVKKDSTCSDVFWGDTWAISTLERILKIKLILLSEENYRNGDKHNVLQCGQLNDSILETEGKFEPNYYLILDYTGNHYKLVLYKKHINFQFSEIPYSIKQMILTKCLEKQSGPFYLIPEFKEYAKRNNLDDSLLKKDIVVDEPTQLFDSNVVFQFYIKSNGKPKPGKGNGEKIPDEKIKDYSKLGKIENWRRKLSNLWDQNPIVLGGNQWKSVEHYYQANKFKKTNPEFFDQFSLDSNSELSQDAILAKAAGGKTGKAGTKVVRPPGVKIDPEFVNKKDIILEDALYAKFSQHDELKDLIINTKIAKLLNYQVGDTSVTANDLMKVRNKIIS